MQVELPGLGWLYSEAPDHMNVQFDQQLLQQLGAQTTLVGAIPCDPIEDSFLHSTS